MNGISNIDLIQKSASVINPRNINGYTIGDVGCALVTDKGNVYTGVSIDTSSGMGFCAEHGAIAAMVTAGESKIERIVATWKNEKEEVYTLPPCGRCREFIKQMDPNNFDTIILLGKENTIELRDLLPHDNEFVKV